MIRAGYSFCGLALDTAPVLARLLIERMGNEAPS